MPREETFHNSMCPILYPIHTSTVKPTTTAVYHTRAPSHSNSTQKAATNTTHKPSSLNNQTNTTIITTTN